MVNLLQRPNENIQTNALWALINLTNNGAWQHWPSLIYILYMRDATNNMFVDANKESVCEVPQAISWLVGLSGGNSHLQAYALKLLANLSESGAAC